MTQSIGLKLEIFIERMAKGIWPEPKPIRPIRQSLQKRAQMRASRAFRRQARRERRKKLEAEAWIRKQQEEMDAYIVRIEEIYRQRMNRKRTLGSGTITPIQSQQGQAPQQPESLATSTVAQGNGTARMAREYTLPGLPREDKFPSTRLISAFVSRVGGHSNEKYNDVVRSFLHQDNVQVLPVPEARDRKRRPIVLTNAYEYYSYVRRLTREERYNGEKLDPFCSPSALLYMVYNGWIELDDVLSWKCGRDALGRGLVEFAGRPDDTTSLIKGTYPTEPEMPMKPSERKVEWFTQKVSMHKKSVSATCSKLSDVDDRLFNGPFGEAVKRFATPGVQERVLKELEVARKGQQVTVQEDWRPLFGVLFRAVYQQRLRSTTVSMPVVAWPAVAPSLFNMPSAIRVLEAPVARDASTTAPSRRLERRATKPYSSTGAKRNLCAALEDASENDEGFQRKWFTPEESAKWQADRVPLGESNIAAPPAPTFKVASAAPPEAENVTKEHSASNPDFAVEMDAPGHGQMISSLKLAHIPIVYEQAIAREVARSQHAPPTYQLDPSSPAVIAPVEQSISPSVTTGNNTTSTILIGDNQADGAPHEPPQPLSCDVSMEAIDVTMTSSALAPFPASNSFVPDAIGATAAPLDEMEMDATVDAMDADVHFNIDDFAQAPTQAKQNEIQMQAEPFQNEPASPWISNADSQGQVQFGGQTQEESFDASHGQIPLSLTTSGLSPGAAIDELSASTPSSDSYGKRPQVQNVDVRQIIPLPAHTLCTIEAQPNIFDVGAPAMTPAPAFHLGVASPKTEQSPAKGRSRGKRNGLKRL